MLYDAGHPHGIGDYVGHVQFGLPEGQVNTAKTTIFHYLPLFAKIFMMQQGKAQTLFCSVLFYRLCFMGEVCVCIALCCVVLLRCVCISPFFVSENVMQVACRLPQTIICNDTCSSESYFLL